MYHYYRQLDCWFEGFQVSSWWKLTSQRWFSRNLFFQTSAAMMKVGHIFWHLWYCWWKKTPAPLMMAQILVWPHYPKTFGVPIPSGTHQVLGASAILCLQCTSQLHGPVLFRWSDGCMWGREAKFMVIIVTIGEVLLMVQKSHSQPPGMYKTL